MKTKTKQLYSYTISVHSGTKGWTQHIIDTNITFEEKDMKDGSNCIFNSYRHEKGIYPSWKVAFILGRLGFDLNDIDSAYVDEVTFTQIIA